MATGKAFRKLAVLAVVAGVATLVGAYEIPVGGDFADTGPDGFPSAWTWHDYSVYLPHAQLKVKPADGGNELHYFGTKGSSGSALRSKKRIPAKAGDLVSVSLEAKGSGKVWVSLYCWDAKGGWVQSLTPQEIALAGDWEKRLFTFTIADSSTAEAASFELALGLKPGADAWFRNVRVVRRLEIDKVLAMDDYETDSVRSGNPELVRGDIAPGLLSPTRKGVYRTSSRIDIVPTAHQEMPVGGFLTSGVRLYGFGANGNGRIGTAFSHADGKFIFSIAPDGGEIACRFTGGERFAVPATTLPADFVFSASIGGEYDLAITSLANSQTMRFSGKADFFCGATSGVERTVALLSSNGKVAEATVDNVFLAVSRNECEAKLVYPYLAKPESEFDPAKAGWPLVFSDEFDGNAVDRSKWEVSKGKTGENAIVKDGMLKIRADYVPGSTNKLMSTGLWSVPKFLYGYFEARLKFTTYNGWWAAFWLCSRATCNPFLDGFEIDIFEDYYMRNPARNKLDHNLHIKSGGALKSWNYNSILPKTYRDWYTIGCKWTPFEITYYLDGKAIKSTARHSPYETVTFDAFRHGTCTKPIHAVLSGQIMKVAYGKHDPDPSEVYPEYFDVDYVRVYGYPGSAQGASPEVALSSSCEGRFTVPQGTLLSFKVDPKPARKTGAKIKAVHLFDSGYYLCTKSEPPYEFVFPFTVSFFSRTAWAKPGRSGVRPDFGGSLHAMCAFVEDENGEIGHSRTISFMSAPNGESRPFRGEAAKLPGVVRAGHYDEGGQGIAYFDTTQGNSGGGWRPEEWVDGGEDTIGSVSSGEWLRYTVDIAKAGRYRVKFNYGTPTRYGHTVDLLLDGERLCTLGPMAEHESADWRVDMVAESEVTLPAGRHVLMLHLFGLFNFGKIEFEEIK